MLSKLFTAVDGCKTNLGLVGLGIVGVLAQYGQMDPNTAAAITQVLYVWTGVAVAHKATKFTEALRETPNGK